MTTRDAQAPADAQFIGRWSPRAFNGEALSHAEAADLLGCSETTVSWHIHEAKKRLKLIMSAGEV